MRRMARVLPAAAAVAGVAALLFSLSPARAALSPARQARAQQAYLAYCAMCHGPDGAADGEVAVALRRSETVVPHLDNGARLQAVGRAGVLRVIMRGGGHTGRSNIMPSWGTLLGPGLAEDITDYVMDIPNRRPGVPEATIQKYLKSPPGVPAEGRKLYVYHCSACHGAGGKGDGPSGEVLRRKRNARTRDLTDARYMATRTDQDLFVVISLGGGHLGKSVFMPAWTVDLTPAQIKDLVAYLRALSKTRARP